MIFLYSEFHLLIISILAELNNKIFTRNLVFLFATSPSVAVVRGSRKKEKQQRMLFNRFFFETLKKYEKSKMNKYLL
jgi:hypothetical protein